MTDTREDILAQVVVCLQTVTGLHNVFRNRDQLPNAVLPAAVVLDGREEIITEIQNTRSVKMPPALFELWPQVWLALPPRDTVDNEYLNGQLNPIGPELSHFRMLMIDSILNDPTLATILGPNGQMAYRGCETDMAIGSSVKGNLMLQFSFRYVFIPPRN